MKNYVFCITFIFITLSVAAQQLIPFEQNSQWGLKKSNNDEVIIEPIFDKFIETKYNVFISKKEKFYGLIDSKGNIILKANNKGWVIRSSNNHGIIKVGNTYYIAKKEKGLISYNSYEGAEILSKKTIVVKKDEKWMLIDAKGKKKKKKTFNEFVSASEGNVLFRKNNKWYFWKKEKIKKIKKSYDSLTPVHFNNNYYLYAIKNNKHGLLSSKVEVIPCNYDTLYLWANEYFIVMVENADNYGFLSYEYNKFKELTACIFPVKENQHIKYNIKNNSGSIPFPVYQQGKIGFISYNIVYPCIYAEYDKEAYKNGKLKVKQGNKWFQLSY